MPTAVIRTGEIAALTPCERASPLKIDPFASFGFEGELPTSSGLPPIPETLSSAARRRTWRRWLLVAAGLGGWRCCCARCPASSAREARGAARAALGPGDARRGQARDRGDERHGVRAHRAGTARRAPARARGGHRQRALPRQGALPARGGRARAGRRDSPVGGLVLQVPELRAPWQPSKASKGLTVGEVQDQVRQGAKFVVFGYAMSFLVVTLKRSSDVTFVRAGQSAVRREAAVHAALLLPRLVGLPLGLIYTPMAIIENLGGGTDVTWR